MTQWTEYLPVDVLLEAYLGINEFQSQRLALVHRDITAYSIPERKLRLEGRNQIIYSLNVYFVCFDFLSFTWKEKCTFSFIIDFMNER